MIQTMKEIISRSETKYLSRRLAPRMREAIEQFPVVVLTGARQVGKSTLLQREFQDFSYLTLDDFDVRARAGQDPASLWKGRDRIILDEAQKEPRLMEAVKAAVDRSGRKLRFILSGSANILLMERVTESLAGRAIYLELLPLTWGEMHGVPDGRNFPSLWDEIFEPAEEAFPETDPLPHLLRGFMPPVWLLERSQDVLLWLEGYVRTYLERDLRELSQVDSLVDFRRLMQALALRTASVLNQADAARDAGLSPATAHRYIRLLEVSNILQRVPAFASSRSKRVVKSPKVFFLDPALAVFLAGYHDQEALRNSRELGHFFETMVGLLLRARCENMIPRAGLFYWRTVAGHEVDFILEQGRKLLAVEVKMTASPNPADARNLLRFLEQHPAAVRGVLVHAGNRLLWLHSRVLAVPWWWLDM
jgi:uncharacterized protein